MAYGKLDTTMGRQCISHNGRVFIIRDDNVLKPRCKKTYVKFDLDYVNRAINLEVIAYERNFYESK